MILTKIFFTATAMGKKDTDVADLCDEWIESTVIDSEVEASRSKVALLGIANPSRSSFSFGLEEWLLLIELWTKAVKAQSGSWKVVGSMAETKTSDVSHLAVSAGVNRR